MERDFLGAIGRPEKDGEAVKEQGRTEPDYPGAAPAMQWQFPAKSGVAPAVMSFRSVREDNFKEFSISGFRPAVVAGDAFDSIKKQASLPVMPQQRQFGLDTQVTAQQYAAAAHSHRAQAAHHLLGGSRMAQPLSRHPVPFNPANPALRVQSHHNAASSLFRNQPFTTSNAVNGSTVGKYGVRNQKSTQLTIFYGGSVNVFDNVPAEKVQELMLLVSRASIPSPPSSLRKPDSPISAPAKDKVPEVLPARQILSQKPESSVPHLASTSSPTPNVPQAAALLRSTSNCITECTGPKTAIQPPVVAPTSQASSPLPTPLTATTAEAIMRRAVPQARKASLARFLEKRKERVTSVEPYPTSKSPLEGSDTIGSASAPAKSSSTDIAPSYNGEEPLRFGQTRNISFSCEVCPSTKLQI